MAEDAMIYRADHAAIANGTCPDALTKHEDCHGAATAKGPIPEHRVGVPLSGTLGIARSHFVGQGRPFEVPLSTRFASHGTLCQRGSHLAES